MCVVCMKQGGGAGGIFVSFPCATPPPPFLMTFPLVLVGGAPPPLLWTLGGGRVVGRRLSVNSETHRSSVYKRTLSLSYTPWRQHEKRVQGRLDEEEGPLLRGQED